jgi:hypothetical protein
MLYKMHECTQILKCKMQCKFSFCEVQQNFFSRFLVLEIDLKITDKAEFEKKQK